MSNLWNLDNSEILTIELSHILREAQFKVDITNSLNCAENQGRQPQLYRKLHTKYNTLDLSVKDHH